MRMLLIATLATLAAAQPALADPVTRSFEHEGVVYRYTETIRGDDTYLRGYASPGSRFNLHVHDGRVSGVVGMRRVNFTVEEARDRLQLAAND